MTDSDSTRVHTIQDQPSPITRSEWSELRSDIRELRKEIANVNGQLSSNRSATDRNELHISAMTKTQAEITTDQRTMAGAIAHLEEAERARVVADSNAKEARQPKQYGAVATAAISSFVGMVIVSLGGWVMISWAKAIVAAGHP